MKMLFNETQTTVILDGGRLRLLPKGTVIDGTKRDRIAIDDTVMALPDVKRFVDKKKITIVSLEDAASREANEKVVATKKVKSAHQSGDGLSAVPPPRPTVSTPSHTRAIETHSVLEEKRADDAKIKAALENTDKALEHSTTATSTSFETPANETPVAEDVVETSDADDTDDTEDSESGSGDAPVHGGKRKKKKGK
jgi:hypothetical protein